MIKTFDHARFLKLLALAESDMDGEALAAIRKARALARAAGLSLGEAAGNRAINHGADFYRQQNDRLEMMLKNADRHLAELAARVKELEAELEGCCDPHDWRGLADRFHARHPAAKGGKEIAYQAAVNKLTTEDRTTLREFARTKARRTT